MGDSVHNIGPSHEIVEFYNYISINSIFQFSDKFRIPHATTSFEIDKCERNSRVSLKFMRGMIVERNWALYSKHSHLPTHISQKYDVAFLMEGLL